MHRTLYHGYTKNRTNKTRGVNVNYDDKALIYAEKHGIIAHEVIGNTMNYTETFPMEKSKYNVNVNLDTMQETRKEIKIK